MKGLLAQCGLKEHIKSSAIADTEVAESAAPDGTAGGSAGGWNPTRQGLGGANTDTTSRAHRREAIARDPHTIATRRRAKTVPIRRLRRVGVAASGKARDGVPHSALDAIGDTTGRRPSARLGTALLRRWTGGVSSQKSHSALQHDSTNTITGIAAADSAHPRREHDGDHSLIRVRTTFHSSMERDSGCRPAKAPPNIPLDHASRTVTPSH